jgi:hypothetical protein
MREELWLALVCSNAGARSQNRFWSFRDSIRRFDAKENGCCGKPRSPDDLERR